MPNRKERTQELRIALKLANKEVADYQTQHGASCKNRDTIARDLDVYEEESRRLAGELPA